MADTVDVQPAICVLEANGEGPQDHCRPARDPDSPAAAETTGSVRHSPPRPPPFKASLRRGSHALLVALSLTACHGTVPERPHQRTTSSDTLQAGAGAVPAQREVYLQLIGDMQRQQAWTASLAHIDAYRRQYGDSDTLELLRAEALRHTLQQDAALPIYRRLVHTPLAAAAWRGMGMIESSGHHHDAALTDFENACSADPLDPDSRSDLGFERLRAGALDQAAADLARAVELAPDNHRAIARLAVLRLLAGQTADASILMENAAFSAQARADTYRMAHDMRHQVLTAAHAGQSGSPLRRPPSPTPHAMLAPVPGSMLERFAPAPAKPEAASRDGFAPEGRRAGTTLPAPGPDRLTGQSAH